MAQGALKNYIPQVLDRIGINDHNFSFMSIIERNLPTVGKTAQLVGIKNNRIYIEIESSAEFQEARFKKRELLKSLAQAFPGPETASFDIRFSLKGTAMSAPKFIRLNPVEPKPPAARRTFSRRKITGQ